MTLLLVVLLPALLMLVVVQVATLMVLVVMATATIGLVSNSIDFCWAEFWPQFLPECQIENVTCTNCSDRYSGG